MPVDVGDENIRIRVKDPGQFVDSSFRTITISADEGIKAVIGKLKSDPGGSTTIQSYIFDKEKWSASEAEKWIADHKKSQARIIERRCLPMDDQEMRFSVEGKRQAKISGYAAVFNKEIELFSGYFEKVSPGAFARTIATDDVRALWNHNDDWVLGRKNNGTLLLSEDERGLKYEILPPDTTWANDLVTSIKRGDVTQASFGFNIVTQERKTEGQAIHRTLKEVRLFDVSPVTFPAYSTTSADVHVRSIDCEGERYVWFEDTDEVIAMASRSGLPEEQSKSNPFERLDELKQRIAWP